MHPVEYYSWLTCAFSAYTVGRMEEQLNIRLSTKDRELLQHAADVRRLPLSAYIRMVAIEAAEGGA